VKRGREGKAPLTSVYASSVSCLCVEGRKRKERRCVLDPIGGWRRRGGGGERRRRGGCLLECGGEALLVSVEEEGLFFERVEGKRCLWKCCVLCSVHVCLRGSGRAAWRARKAWRHHLFCASHERKVSHETMKRRNEGNQRRRLSMEENVYEISQGSENERRWNEEKWRIWRKSKRYIRRRKKKKIEISAKIERKSLKERNRKRRQSAEMKWRGKRRGGGEAKAAYRRKENQRKRSAAKIWRKSEKKRKMGEEKALEGMKEEEEERKNMLEGRKEGGVSLSLWRRRKGMKSKERGVEENISICGRRKEEEEEISEEEEKWKCEAAILSLWRRKKKSARRNKWQSRRKYLYEASVRRTLKAVSAAIWRALIVKGELIIEYRKSAKNRNSAKMKWQAGENEELKNMLSKKWKEEKISISYKIWRKEEGISIESLCIEICLGNRREEKGRKEMRAGGEISWRKLKSWKHLEEMKKMGDSGRKNMSGEEASLSSPEENLRKSLSAYICIRKPEERNERHRKYMMKGRRGKSERKSILTMWNENENSHVRAMSGWRRRRRRRVRGEYLKMNERRRKELRAAKGEGKKGLEAKEEERKEQQEKEIGEMKSAAWKCMAERGGKWRRRKESGRLSYHIISEKKGKDIRRKAAKAKAYEAKAKAAKTSRRKENEGNVVKCVFVWRKAAKNLEIMKKSGRKIWNGGSAKSIEENEERHLEEMKKKKGEKIGGIENRRAQKSAGKAAAWRRRRRRMSEESAGQKNQIGGGRKAASVCISR